MESNNVAVIIIGAVVAMLAILQLAEAQTQHVVGGSEGWKIPSNDSVYQDWANNQNFSVGDILVFNFVTNQHDVVEVPKDSYDICSPEFAMNTTMKGPAKLTLNNSGQFYYICSFGTHCIQGQKLAIIVSNSSSSSVAPSPQSSWSPAVVTTTATAAATFSLIFIFSFMGVIL